MHIQEQKNIKLIPLRKFATSGGYSAAYLSQLVQRKKLRAKRLGRNYYTCDAWFTEYLDTFARDSKCELYMSHSSEKSYLSEKIQNIKIQETKVLPGRLQQVALAAIILIALFAANFTYLVWRDGKGRVAGQTETSNATTSAVIEPAIIEASDPPNDQ